MAYQFSSTSLSKKELRKYNQLFNQFLGVSQHLSTENFEGFVSGSHQARIEDEIVLLFPDNLSSAESGEAYSFTHRLLNNLAEELRELWSHHAISDIERLMEQAPERLAGDLTWLLAPTMGLTPIKKYRLKKEI